MAFEQAAGIGIDDEDGTLTGIEKNTVGRFWADAMDGEQLCAQNGRGSAKHFRQRAMVFRAKEGGEGFQFLGLLAEVARGANQASKAQRGVRIDSAGVAEATRPTAFHGSL